ncbi:MAG: SIS domain-containing protein [Chitinophagaceae bacterium]|nr:SIS domain-containing protein [Chitinophagaceae bacterium]
MANSNNDELSEQNHFNGHKYFGQELLNAGLAGGIYTSREIVQQPKLWRETYDLIISQKTSLENFLKEAYSSDNLEVILTGAGSSAFIGKILQGPFQKNTGKRTSAIATTDLLSHPEEYFNKENTTLLISFARSGDSPESVAAVNLANMLCKKVYHLIITCSPSGKLAREAKTSGSYVFLLPKHAADQSLVMTGSFTSMLLTGLLISQMDSIHELKKHVDLLASYAEKIITEYTPALKKVAQMDFDRVVVLGSGPLQGAAREAHLKIQELSAGKVICTCDSFLGVRHGPRAVISPTTLLIYLFSNNEYAHQYEIDLVKSVSEGEKGIFSIGISESPVKEIDLGLGINLSNGTDKLNEGLLAICSVLPAQILGYFKSIQLKLKPDNPSENGTITRVVQGVTIYNFPANEESRVY